MNEIDKTNLTDQTKIRLNKITEIIIKQLFIKRLIKGNYVVKN